MARSPRTDPWFDSLLKLDLSEWARVATAQGKVRTASVALLALSRIEELEAMLVSATANRHRGGKAKASGQTAEQRKAWAVNAANRRWRKTA